jgi:hypothetical protein
MDFESELKLKGKYLPHPENLASHLSETLTWQQLRKLAKKNKIHQYSYLNKKGLATVLAYYAFNRACRYFVYPNDLEIVYAGQV